MVKCVSPLSACRLVFLRINRRVQAERAVTVETPIAMTIASKVQSVNFSLPFLPQCLHHARVLWSFRLMNDKQTCKRTKELIFFNKKALNAATHSLQWNHNNWYKQVIVKKNKNIMMNTKFCTCHFLLNWSPKSYTSALQVQMKYMNIKVCF